MKPISQMKQNLYLAAGFTSVGLGIIGIFLPIMPTAPFMILAAFLFSRGSKKWHQWLLNHPHFGVGLADWERHGVIQKKHKILATFMIGVSAVSVTYFSPIIWMTIACYVLFVLVLTFIWTRPSEPRSQVSGQ